jgi:GNAT superfamily N-acetyltransferase
LIVDSTGIALTEPLYLDTDERSGAMASMVADPVMVMRLANSIKNLMGVCKLDEEYTSEKTGDKFELESKMTGELSYEEKEEIYKLFEVNMREYYEKTWGLKREEKMNELFHPMSRIFCMYSKDDTTSETTADSDAGAAAASSGNAKVGSRRTLAAYTIFRFEWDDEEEPEYPVLYCYELQTQPTYQGRGLGKRLMEVLSNTCSKLKLNKVMLTCFNINESALAFYKAIGFKVDDNSPSKCGFPSDYEILSKE